MFFLLIALVILLTAVSGFVAIYYYKWDESRLGVVSTIATMWITVMAAGVAYNQLTESRSASAKGVYKEYISMAFQNPELSAASYPHEKPGFYLIKSNPITYEKYENFVAFLLYSAEEILALDGLGEGWCFTLRDQFKYHAIYLDGDRVNGLQYSSILFELIKDGVEIYWLEHNYEAVGLGGKDFERLKFLSENCRVSGASFKRTDSERRFIRRS